MVPLLQIVSHHGAISVVFGVGTVGQIYAALLGHVAVFLPCVLDKSISLPSAIMMSDKV